MSIEQIEVKHTGGIGAFFYAAIPASLGGAALMWLAFYTGIIDWQKSQRVEGRMDARVGVHGELTKPVDLIIRKDDCILVSRAFLDSGAITAYVTNTCHANVSYWEIHYNQLSPDGTIIDQWYTNQYGGLQPGDTVETHNNMAQDSRVSKVVTWATSKH